MTFTPSRRPRLWFSNTDGSAPLDKYRRTQGYVRSPIDWLRSCFQHANDLGMDLVISMPNGDETPPGQPQAFTAGDFEHPDARSAFIEELERFPLAAGLYIGRKMPMATLDPANAATRKFFRETLGPYFASRMKILGGDATRMNPASAQRLHDACACFGVSFFGEGVPYGDQKLYRNMPWMGTVEDYLNNADPTLTTVLDPARTEVRVRVEMHTPLDVVRKLRANNVIVDVLTWVGEVVSADVVQAATNPG